MIKTVNKDFIILVYILFISFKLKQSAAATIQTCGDAFDVTCMDTQLAFDKIYSNGYHGISGNSSVNVSTNSLYIRGAFAAESISPIIGSPGLILHCTGSFACSSISSIVWNHDIYGSGSNSLYKSVIKSARMIYFYGDQSCRGCNISQFYNIFAYGAYSLLFSTIDSNNVTGNVIYVTFQGYYSGFGSKIICRPGDSCNINCWGNGCYMTEIECNSNCVINLYDTVIGPINDSSLFNVSTLNLLYDSNAIETQADNKCNEGNSILYDDSQEYENGAYIIKSDQSGSICCRGYESCRGVNNSQLNTTNEDAIVCTGKFSCSDSNKLFNQNGNILCGGYVSCQFNVLTQLAVEITAKNVYCGGWQSCRGAHIVVSQNLYCGGSVSCEETIIETAGHNINIVFGGYGSGEDAQILCHKGDFCHIICGTRNSCYHTRIQCDGECNIDCQELYHCPNITTATPTGNPTYNPTFYPTTDPTLEPTINPTGNPTSEPTINPTFYPTVNPTINPTTYPTINPSNYPTAVPTVDPTKYPTNDPTYNPTSTPSNNPTHTPTNNPTQYTNDPTSTPSNNPTDTPTNNPTQYTINPTGLPTFITKNPTSLPTFITKNPTPSPTRDSTNDTNACYGTVASNVSLVWTAEKQNSDAIKLQNEVQLNTTKLEIAIKTDILSQIQDDINDQNEDKHEQNNCEEQDILVAITVIETGHENVFTMFLEITVNAKDIQSLYEYVNQQDFDDEIKYDIDDLYDADTEETEVIVKIISVIIYRDKPLSTSQQPTNQFVFDNVSKTFNLVSIGLICTFILLAIIGLIDAKCIRKNDIFQLGVIIIFAVYTLDFMSDILFAAQVIVSANSMLGYIIFILCCIFIVLPLSLNLMQLRNEIGIWLHDPYNSTEIEAYLMKNGKMLGLLTIITGNSFAVINLCSSALFSFDVFWIGLRQQQLMRFKTKRLYSVVLLENIPQMILQLLYGIKVEDNFSSFTLFVFIFSGMSVLVSIFEVSTHRQILKNNSSIMEISFEVFSKEVEQKSNRLQFIQSVISEGIARILYENIDRRGIEQLRPKKTSDGINLRFRINVIKSTIVASSSENVERVDKGSVNNIKKTIQNKIDDGGLAQIINSAWRLTKVPGVRRFSVVNVSHATKSTDSNIPLVGMMRNEVEQANKSGSDYKTIENELKNKQGIHETNTSTQDNIALPATTLGNDDKQSDENGNINEMGSVNVNETENP